MAGRGCCDVRRRHDHRVLSSGLANRGADGVAESSGTVLTMPTKRWMAGLFAAVSLVIPLASVVPVRAETAPELPTSIEDLFEVFGVADVPGDFVVVVDTSGSMSAGTNPPYPRVREAFSAFVDAVPEGDNLAVVTFDTDPRVSFDQVLTADNRDEAKAALPAEADGDKTDIGAALEATIRRLDRPDSAQNQTVIFLTDGAHEPPRGSTYPGASGPEWDALRTQADGIGSVHDLLVLGVALGERGGSGIELVRQVFGSPEINAMPADQLPDFFRESVRRSQVARLRTLVDEETARGVRVGSSEVTALAGTIETEVEVTSDLQHLPVDVTIASVSATDDDGAAVRARVISPERRTLGPGETAVVTVRLEPPVADAGFRVPEVMEAARYEVALDATYQTLPADLLSRVTATPTTGAVTGIHAVEASRTYGYSVNDILAILAGAAVALMILAWLYRRFLWLPDLVGVFVLDGQPEQSAERREIRLKGKRQMITGKQVPGAGGAKIEVFTRRGKPKRVYARVEAPPFAAIDGKRERTVSDEVEIFVNHYRLGGGRFQYRAEKSRRD